MAGRIFGVKGSYEKYSLVERIQTAVFVGAGSFKTQNPLG